MKRFEFFFPGQNVCIYWTAEMTWLHDYYININMYGPHFAAIKKDDGRTTLPKVINIEKVLL